MTADSKKPTNADIAGYPASWYENDVPDKYSDPMANYSADDKAKAEADTARRLEVIRAARRSRKKR